MTPELVAGVVYDRREIWRRVEARAASPGRVVVGRAGVALFVPAVAESGGPTFPARSTLEWPGEVPKRAVDGTTPVLVFLDVSEEQARYLGAARIARYRGTRSPRDAAFTLDPPLTRSAWLDRLAGSLPPPGQPPDAALAGLTAASPPDRRWAALATFLERWYGTPAPELRTANGATVGPPLLRAILSVSAATPEVVQQNRLVSPEALAEEDGKVVFLVENQGVCVWATEPAGEDPRVWVRENEDGAPWVEEPQRLSGFLIQAILFEAILQARFGASATALRAEAVRAILERVSPLGDTAWSWGGARFFARDGALVMTMEHDGACDVWLAARTPAELSAFEDVVDAAWDHVAF